ncbi:hypothetical protein [Xylanimonas allomyrinae]|uniref:hypothetical protein n=1 Tax=Xylanimonas allomyrinae TaxID=2509459 RepID=UPI0013A65092|nr:hypothetical protein [Xylanimonas allomyrinae]
MTTDAPPDDAALELGGRLLTAYVASKRDMAAALRNVLPWVAHLPGEDLRDMAVEVERLFAELGRPDYFGRLARAVRAWQATAEQTRLQLDAREGPSPMLRRSHGENSAVEHLP